VVAAGWKGQLAGEDCLFAGALLHHIGERNVDAKGINDALLMAEISFQKYKDDLLSFINRVEHYARLEQLGYLPTIAVCLEQDRYPILPLFDLERQTLLPL
jgi:putative 2-phosphosulfolactate phosphatase